MAFEINFNNPTDGGTAFLASYLGAKKKADAETARLKALQQQRMADTIGGAIGNVGGSFGRGWSEGVVNRYRMQDQQKLDADRAALNAKYQEQRDARQFDYDKQIAQYRSDLSRDDRFYDNFQMSPDDAESLGQREWESAPPQVRGQIASSLGLDPEQADTLFAGDGPEAKALRRQTAITSIRMREQGAKVEQARQIAQIRENRELQIAEQKRQAEAIQGFLKGQVAIPIVDPKNDPNASLKSNYAAAINAQSSDEFKPEAKADALRKAHAAIAAAVPFMEPVKKPPKTQEELIENSDIVPAMHNGKQIGVYTRSFNSKGQQTYNLEKFDGGKDDMSQDLELDPATGTPKIYGDNSGREWVNSKSKGKQPAPAAPIAKETPEQKREAERNKKLTDFVASLAKEMVPEVDANGIKKAPRPLTDDERREKIRQFKAGLEEINDDSEQGPTAPNTKVDAQGFSPVDRLRNAIDSGLPPGQIDDFVNAVMPSMAPEQVGQVKKYGRDYYNFKRRTKQAPQQQAAPQQQKYPEGTVAEDASGNRRVMKNGQWVPINGG